MIADELHEWSRIWMVTPSIQQGYLPFSKTGYDKGDKDGRLGMDGLGCVLILVRIECTNSNADIHKRCAQLHNRGCLLQGLCHYTRWKRLRLV